MQIDKKIMRKLNFYESNGQTKIQDALGYINLAVEFIELEEKRLLESTVGINNKIMPIKQCNKMGQVYSSISSYIDKSVGLDGSLSHKGGYYSKPNTVEQTCSYALLHAEGLFRESEAIHNENIPAIENNKQLREYIETFMSKIGISRTYKTYDYISSSGRRVSKQQEHTNTAGYINDMNIFIKVDDGFGYAQLQLENFKKTVESYRTTEAKKEKEKQDAIDRENATKEENKLLATLVVKYGLDYQSTFDNVLDAILERNKYLELAYWLERQRNDWSDGFWKASQGIDGFSVETDLDKKIHSSLRETLSECEDGRDFRDCEYNYSVLYAMVEDQDLLKDFQLVFNKVEF